MNSLNQLAQVAQLAGSKRKFSQDTEADLANHFSSPPEKTSYSYIQPWPDQWPYPQPTFGEPAQHLQFHSSNLPQPSLQSFGLSESGSNRGFSAGGPFPVPPHLDPLSSRHDNLTDSTASPSTEGGYRNWRHSATSTAHTSCASSPDAGNTLRVSQLDPGMNTSSFPCHQTLNHHLNHGINKHIFTSHPRATNPHRPESQDMLRTSAMVENSGIIGDEIFLPIDCAQAITCSDPDCRDAIPCSTQHLTTCEKADCDDAIPCPITGGQIFDEKSATSYPDQSCLDCNMNFTPLDYCCSDTCPQETRCPSPCFEEDCGVPPCDMNHVSLNSWQATQEAHLDECIHGCMDGCVDPRHTFRGHELLEVSNVQWGDRLRDQLFKDVHDDNQFNIKEDTSNEEMAQPGGSQSKRGLSNSEKLEITNSKAFIAGCSHSTKRHHSASRGPPIKHRHICQWVVRGCSESGDAAICGHEFSECKDLQHHVVAHIEGLQRENDLFPCCWLGCGHRFSNGFMARPKLKRHLMVHTGAAPYKCDEPGCNVAMKTKDALDKHRRTHTGSKPYICTHPGCDSRFATSTELKTHLIVHSGQKPHKCPRCGDCFADSSNLSKHKKVHEVPKFACPDCEFRMKRWDQMRRHFLSQGHGSHIVANKTAELEYKRQMQEAFDKLTPEERSLPLGRDESRAAGVLSDGVSPTPSRPRSRHSSIQGSSEVL